MSHAGLKVSGLVAACLLVWGQMALAQVSERTERSENTEEKSVTRYKEVLVERTTRIERETEIKIAKPKARYTCAIFVTNRSERIPDKKVLVMQDFFTGHCTDRGFKIIAREDVINSVAKLALDGPNKGDPRLVGAAMDEVLSNNTSALRLTQAMDADYVLMVSITSFGTDKRRFVRNGIDLLGLKHQVKCTYKLLDGTLGGSLTAGVATMTIEDRVDPREEAIERQNLVDDLLDAAAADMSAMIGRARQEARIPDDGADNKKEVEFKIHCSVADMVYPEVVKDQNTGQYVISAGKYHLEAMGFQVHLDGILIGTTSKDGWLKARPGLHKLRLTRPMFMDHESTVMIRDQAFMDITVEMSAQGLKEFVAMTQFFGQLKRDQILTEAQAKMWEQYAKQLEQQQLRPDRRRDATGPGTGNPNRDDIRRRILEGDEARPGTPAPNPTTPRPNN